MAESLVEQGAQVTMLAMSTAKHPAGSLENKHQQFPLLNIICVDVPARITIAGAIRNLLFSSLPYHVVRYASAGYRKAIIRCLSEQIDIVQIESLYLLGYVPLIRRFSKAKIVFRPHNFESEIWMRLLANEQNTFKRAALDLLVKRLWRYEKRIMNTYDLLVPISSHDLRSMTEAGNIRPAVVIPYGITCHRSPSDYIKNNLCFIGALDWYPNQEGLLWFIEKVWPWVLDKFPDLLLHVAGRNCPLWLIQKLQGKGIVFYGQVDDGNEFINNFGIMIVPLLSGSGIRIRILDGLAAGKIIVTTPVGAEGLPVVHGKHLLIAADSDSFVTGLCNVLQNPQDCKSLSLNGRKLVMEQFERKSLAAKLLNFYQTHLSD